MENGIVTDKEMQGETDGPQTSLGTLVQYVDDYLEATKDEREESELCRDYYDGKQWTDEEITELNKRNQPVLTFNRIARKVNTLRGHEIASRRDPTAEPRTKEHEEDARAITDALRFVCDDQNFDVVKSSVVEELIIEGASACIVFPEERPNGDVRLKVTHIPWDRYVRDPHSRDPGYRDGRFHGIVKWRSFDDVRRAYKDTADEAIESERNRIGGLSDFTDDSTHDDRPKLWFDSKHKRMKVTELYWYEVTENGGQQWWVAHYCKTKFLAKPKKLPFVTDAGESYCPIIGASAYVDRDNRRYGIVRHLLSPQDEINKRRSMALRASLGRQVIVEDGVLKSEADAKTEFSKPDGIVRVARDSLKDQRFQIPDRSQFDQTQFQLYLDAKQELDGVASDAIANTGATEESGRLFLAREASIQKEYGQFWDNVRQFELRVYRVMYYMIRQFWTAPKWLRVRDAEGPKGYKFVKINNDTTRGERYQELFRSTGDQMGSLQSALGEQFQAVMGQVQQQLQMMSQQTGQPPQPGQDIAMLLQSPIMMEPIRANDVARADVDILIDTSPDASIIEHEQFMLMLKMHNQGVQLPLDMIIEMSSLRNKQQILAKMRQGPTPEQQQAQQQQQQLEQQAIQAQTAVMMAEAQKSQAQAEKSRAEAQKAAAEIQTEQARMRELMAKAEEILAEAERERAHARKLSAEAEQIAAGSGLGPAAP